MKRADVLKWSKVASTKSLKKPTPEKPKVLRMRDIPAVAELERHLLLYGIGSPEIDKEAIRVCLDLFGIEPFETEYVMPAEYQTLSDYDPKKERLYHEWVEYESQFETGDDLTDDETAEVLRKFDLDFLDERGQPLRCTKLLGRVAELAAKGIKGKLPDRESLQLKKLEDTWSKSLSEEIIRDCIAFST
ncbi:MAG: hypothetical protein Q8M24_24440 [Pseudolabrys sp.]|nr:hypothetical protein [Pseudolabrys sp.]